MRRFAYDHAGLVQRVGAIELKQLETEIAKFNRQYKGLSVTYSDDFHDRFLIIDNVELHGLGSSINCLGRLVTLHHPRREGDCEAAGNDAISERPRSHRMSCGTKTTKFIFCAEVVA